MQERADQRPWTSATSEEEKTGGRIHVNMNTHTRSKNFTIGPSTPMQDNGMHLLRGNPLEDKISAKAEEKEKAGEETKEEENDTIQDGKETKAKARGSKESAGTVVRRGIRRRIVQKEKGKEKETEAKEDGA